jgi:hypothetical protein
MSQAVLIDRRQRQRLRMRAGGMRDDRRETPRHKPLDLLVAFVSERAATSDPELGKASAKHLTAAPALGRWCLSLWPLYLECLCL